MKKFKTSKILISLILVLTITMSFVLSFAQGDANLNPDNDGYYEDVEENKDTQPDGSEDIFLESFLEKTEEEEYQNTDSQTALINTEENKDYTYFDKQYESDTAYAIFGEQLKGNKMSYMEGNSEDYANPDSEFYNEKTSELGVEGRKFYKANNVNFKINEDFCSDQDREFLVSIAYYDYGPNPGRFFFEYMSDDGILNTVTIQKSGAVQDWFVKSIYISNADFKKVFESGANARLKNNAYNLFKRIEIINISKLKREGRIPDVNIIGMDEKEIFVQLGLVDSKSPILYDGNLQKKCTQDDVEKIFSVISGQSKSGNNSPITIENLLKKCFELAKVPYNGEDILQTAYKEGILYNKNLVFDVKADATYYNLLSVIYNTLLYEREDKKTLTSDMIERGCFTEDLIYSISDKNFLKEFYRLPKKCPYTIINDNRTGTQYKYMNIFGQQTIRPYVTFQNWTNDGKSFVAGLSSGQMYLYNTETQMLQYIDVCVISDRAFCIVGRDDCVYYIVRENLDSLWKYDIKTKEKTKLAQAPQGIQLTDISISDDCNYFSADCVDSSNKFTKPGENLLTVYDLKNDKWNWITHKFDFSNDLTHTQINPVYPNLTIFSHEIKSSEGWGANDIYDRIWVHDLDTGTSEISFKQGLRPGTKKAIIGATHEMWSVNGEYVYFIAYNMSDADTSMANLSRTPSIIRYNKDGSHRKYYHNNDGRVRYFSHMNSTGDDKYIVTDSSKNGNEMFLTNTATWEHFAFASISWEKGASHPQQMHPIVARDKYVVNWAGVYDGVLGVMWMDFTDIAQNEFAKGGVVELNETVSSVSYKGLDCEITTTTKSGKDCYYVKANNKMFVDINESIADCVDGKIKLTFEYIDNSRQPLVLTYTAGAKNDNDLAYVENAQKVIPRKATGKWKQAEIIIDSGNFEDAGTYDSDFNIRGLCSSAYIRNIVAHKID